MKDPLDRLKKFNEYVYLSLIECRFREEEKEGM